MGVFIVCVRIGCVRAQRAHIMGFILFWIFVYLFDSVFGCASAASTYNGFCFVGYLNRLSYRGSSMWARFARPVNIVYL